MNNWFGWTGKVLDVDLTNRIVEVQPLHRDFARAFVGGRGMNGKRLFDSLPFGADPLGPENLLFFSTGPLTGTPGATARFNVSFLSPATGFFGDANSGGHWGPELKFAGYDGLIIRGKADSPVYLAIQDDAVEIRDAGDLWGLNVWDTTVSIQRKMKGEFSAGVRDAI